MSAPARVLVAGLPDALASFLARQLPGAAVETAADAPALRSALSDGGWSLLVVDDELPGGPASGLLGGGEAHPPTLLCLPRSADRPPPQVELEKLGVTRVFFHPLDRQELVRQAASVLDRAAEGEPGNLDGLQGAVRQAWQRFRGTILERVDAVECAAIAVLDGGLDEERRRHAEREAHKLAGSVGTFGFAQASRLAREVEIMLQGAAPLGQAEALKLTDLAVALRRELDRPAAPDAPHTSHTSLRETAPEPAAADGTFPDRPPPALLLLVDVEAELGERLVMEAAGRGMRARTVAGVAEARALASGEPPAAVLLDLSADRDGRGLDLIADLAARTPRVPVVVVSARDSFTDRVDVARMGGLGSCRSPSRPRR
jgi:DNA-binding response OmpR family regulator